MRGWDAPTGSASVVRRPPERRQLRRPAPVPDDIGAEGRVVELDAGSRAPEHETAAAHVAAPDKVRRKVQAAAERRLEDVDVLPGRDTAEQHDRSLDRHLAVERLERSIERTPITPIVGGDINVRKLPQRTGGDQLLWSEQTARRRDHVGVRGREAHGVRQLAAEVQPAHERERFAERERAVGEPNRQRQRQSRPHQIRRPPAAAVRRRQKKDARSRHRSDSSRNDGFARPCQVPGAGCAC